MRRIRVCARAWAGSPAGHGCSLDSKPAVMDRRAALALALLFLALFMAERRVALRRRTRPVLGRLLVNAGISALSFTTAALVVRPAALAVFRLGQDTPFGVIHLVSLPPAA